jgi:hypothetical protein
VIQERRRTTGYDVSRWIQKSADKLFNLRRGDLLYCHLPSQFEEGYLPLKDDRFQAQLRRVPTHGVAERILGI